jgi:hypothetical protein
MEMEDFLAGLNDAQLETALARTRMRSARYGCGCGTQHGDRLTEGRVVPTGERGPDGCATGCGNITGRE